jgi:hypothetical protein
MPEVHQGGTRHASAGLGGQTLSVKVDKLAPLTEKAFQGQVIGLAKTLGWEVYHPFLSVFSERGWPDLSMVHEGRGRLLFAELKSDTGKLTKHQEKWLRLLRAAGAECYLWKPADFDSIVEILRRKPCVST